MFKEAAVFSSLAEGEEEYRIQHQDKNTSKVSARPAIHLAEYVIPAIINDSSFLRDIPTGINLHQSVGSFSYGGLHPRRPQISHLPVKLLESPDWNAAQRGRKAGEGEQVCTNYPTLHFKRDSIKLGWCLFLYRSELECGELGCGELGCGESSTEHWSTDHTRTAGVRVLPCVWIYWVPSLKEQCSDYIKNWCNMFGLIGQDQLKETDHCMRTLQYHSNIPYFLSPWSRMY